MKYWIHFVENCAHIWCSRIEKACNYVIELYFIIVNNSKISIFLSFNLSAVFNLFDLSHELFGVKLDKQKQRLTSARGVSTAFLSKGDHLKTIYTSTSKKMKHLNHLTVPLRITTMISFILDSGLANSPNIIWSLSWHESVSTQQIELNKVDVAGAFSLFPSFRIWWHNWM